MRDEEKATVASREQLVSLIQGSDADACGVAVQGAVEEFRELADALQNTCPHGQGPEYALRAELQLAPPGFSEEAVNVPVRGAGEEKQLIEITLAGEFGFALRQTRVLRPFPRRKPAQRNHEHSALRRQTLQSLPPPGPGLPNPTPHESPPPLAFLPAP